MADPGVPPTEWVAIIPVKGLERAKTRMSARPASERSALALAFALDTVRAALDCSTVASVLVVTDDDEVRAATAALGATTVRDEPGAGLLAALALGAEVARGAFPHRPLAALVADLPCLRPEELGRALAAAATAPRAFVSDAAGVGTTLLTALAGRELEPRFGERSRAAHAAGGARELDLPDVPGLRRDVDTEVDLWDARRIGVGPATAAVLGVPAA